MARKFRHRNGYIWKILMFFPRNTREQWYHMRAYALSTELEGRSQLALLSIYMYRQNRKGKQTSPNNISSCWFNVYTNKNVKMCNYFSTNNRFSNKFCLPLVFNTISLWWQQLLFSKINYTKPGCFPMLSVSVLIKTNHILATASYLNT